MQPCKVHKIAIGILVTFGCMCSIFSCVDCKFVHIDVGFNPDNSVYGSGEFGIGLWSMEDPTAPGKCLMIFDSWRVGSITKGDNYYSSSLYNGDVIWFTARIMAIVGAICGLVDVVSA